MLRAGGESASSTLADAQFRLAREYGFASWPKLKRYVALIREPADFHAQTWGRNTWPFLTAVYQGDEDAVHAMLRAEPTLVRAEYAYLQSLHYAVRGGRIEMVQLLLDAGANPLAEGWSGKPLGGDTPLTRARDREQTAIVAPLEDAARKPLMEMAERHEEPPDARGQLEVEMSGLGHRGDMRGARAILDRHPDLAYAGLYEAVHQGHTELARMLLERGADPTRPWRWACWLTPLTHSLRHQRPNYKMASMLMDYGVTANDANGMGMTALHILVGLGTPEVVAWLLDRGAEIDVRDHQFESTPLAWAARFGRAEMVSVLLARGRRRRFATMSRGQRPRRGPAAAGTRRSLHHSNPSFRVLRGYAHCASAIRRPSRRRVESRRADLGVAPQVWGLATTAS